MTDEEIAAIITDAQNSISLHNQPTNSSAPQGHCFVRQSNLSALIALAQRPAATAFQDRVAPWMTATFGPEISMDVVERGDRLLEEVLELLQSVDYDPARVLQLRDYVWGRPAGEPAQEVGGVMVTLAAFCLANGLDMHEAGETELTRIWTKVDQIRAKQASKPKHSPLPQEVVARSPGVVPAGWRLVPIEPTVDMAISGCELSLLSRPDLEGEYVTRIWKDMVAGAPTPPAASGVTDEVVEMAARATRRDKFKRTRIILSYDPEIPPTQNELDDARAPLEAVWPWPAETPRTQVDMRKVVEALGFEPDNHHNAAMCPYCNPKGLALTPPLPPLTDELLERGRCQVGWERIGRSSIKPPQIEPKPTCAPPPRSCGVKRDG